MTDQQHTKLKKLAVVTTHPIQYYAPLFQLLSDRGIIDLKVFYTLGNQGEGNYDKGFNKHISWDIPLLEGYNFEWIKNISTSPSTGHFKGVINPDLNQKIAEYQPDAVLVIGWANSGHLKAIRYFEGKTPVYFRGDSTLLNNRTGIKKLLRQVFLKWVYSHINHAFYVGTNNKAYFKKYGLKEHQLSFSPHAIDNKRFALKQPEQSTEIRAGLNLHPDDTLILYAGKFEPVKDLKLLVNAFIKLDKPSVHLLLAGNGVEEQALKQLAEGNKNIHFTGFKNQTDMPAMYQAADLFCLPSISETWGLAINESMACSVAVLASDKVGCALDLIQPGVNGGIFRSGDLDDLTSQLKQLTESKQKLKTYGAKAAELIAEWNFLNAIIPIEQKLLNETRRSH